MDYRLTIAKRYLFGKRSATLISRITGISVFGVALGVGALIVVLSVMNGFFGFVRDMLVSMDPHVRIESTDPRGLVGADSLAAIAMQIDGVDAVSPFVEGKALLTGGEAEANKVVLVRGISPERAEAMEETVTRTGLGSFDISRRDGRPGVVLGQRLGERYLLTPSFSGQPASRIGLLSAPAIERSLTQVMGVPPGTRFEVRGLYRLEEVYDESYVFVDLLEAQRLFRMSGRVSGIDVRLSDIDDAERVRAILSERLGEGEYRVLTWYDLQKSLYDVMRLEKWGALVILALIVVVAAFNIVGSLTMTVVEKRRDIGVLKAMGVSRADVRRIFLAEGLLIGTVGVGIGLFLGLGLALLQLNFGLVPLAGAESFLIDAYPVSIEPFDVAVVAVVGLGLCLLAAWYPASRAARILPAQAVSLDG